jgi:hypothetical protein
MAFIGLQAIDNQQPCGKTGLSCSPSSRYYFKTGRIRINILLPWK